jgi:heptosyltransferase-1
MAEILIIKTSSLGDVIHQMPALTEARRALPHARLSWVVEEDSVPLVRLHPAADEVIAVASRRWRRTGLSLSVVSELAAFRRALRARAYDKIVDTQGLFRSAVIARLAQGERHGYDAASIREPWASSLYNVRHAVSRTRHAVERNRILSGLALGYRPDGAPDYGLDRNLLRSGGSPPYAVLLHATARTDKQWPADHWIALGKTIAAHDLDLVLPWGRDDERERAVHIAGQLPRASVPGRHGLDGMARLIAGASFVIGVDTGLLHLAAALGVPLVAIFAGSQPALTGPVGAGPIEVVGTMGQAPSVDEVVNALSRVYG